MTWDDVDKSCMLCEMKQKTKWYHEDDICVVAEKLTSGPFVVLKRHTKNPTDEEIKHCKEAAREIFGDDIDFSVRMNMIPSHHHIHCLVEDDTDLSGE